MIRKDKPYMSGVNAMLKGMRKSFGFGSSGNVRHRCTCPVCGAKLVNLYFADGKWQCAKCKKEKENDD